MHCPFVRRPECLGRPGPGARGDAPSDVAVVWSDTLYEVVKSEATAFAEASRIYGVSAVAL